MLARHRVFEYNNVRTFRVCRELCTLFKQCVGYSYLLTNTIGAHSLCVGVNDLGDPTGIHYSRLLMALHLSVPSQVYLINESKWTTDF